MSTLKFNKWQNIDGVTRNSVLQVVSKAASTAQTTSSTSFIDLTDMFLAITPTSATSKILVMGTIHGLVQDDPDAASILALAAYRLLRDSDEIYSPYATSTGNYSFGNYLTNQNTAVIMNSYQMFPITYLDSPSTTSEITYKFQGCVFDSNNTLYFNAGGSVSGNFKSTITLMEIAQ